MEDKNERTLDEETVIDAETEEIKPDAAEVDEETLEQAKERARIAEEKAEKAMKDLIAVKNSRKEEKAKAKAPNIEAEFDTFLKKRNEQSVLKKVVDEKSPFYLPELVDDAQFRKVTGYLPRNIDRTSEEAIHKALKLAVRMWKEDEGEVPAKKTDRSVEADLSASDSKPGGKSGQEEKRKFNHPRPSTNMADWYKKK
ncbi:MAG: hypothetical protein M0R37_14125 [Bacteroidales bacterium]|jgi:alpha-mannosidase|nr:hypothetical protein [Sphaerochaeta sp.]MCK9629712.1 hypothetical protein [Bacteroidales bacterium]